MAYVSLFSRSPTTFPSRSLSLFPGPPADGEPGARQRRAYKVHTYICDGGNTRQYVCRKKKGKIRKGQASSIVMHEGSRDPEFQARSDLLLHCNLALQFGSIKVCTKVSAAGAYMDSSSAIMLRYLHGGLGRGKEVSLSCVDHLYSFAFPRDAASHAWVTRGAAFD